MISYGFPRTVYTNYVSKKRVDPGFPVVEQRGFAPKITVTHSISFLSKIRVVFYPGVNSVLAAKRRTETQRISIAIANLLTSEAYNDRNTDSMCPACAPHVPRMCPACALRDTRTWPLRLTFRYFWSEILTWVPEVSFLERRGASSAAGRHVFGLWPKARAAKPREKKPETAHEKPLAPRILRHLPLVIFASFGGIAKRHVWALSWLSSLSTRNRELGSG